MVQDPVCDREVDERRAKAAGLTSTYNGQTYYFCSEECLREFESCPGLHINPSMEMTTQEAYAG